ncbi:glycerate kinase [Williamsia sp.]|uniref:glycerate kinase family protein n=1 Tax=Williamsia sp. TaxID=1872085 RepID=UPI002F924B4B
MKALIAPDSFGDTLTAVAAAEAIAAGWAESRPDDDLILAPQSDGGPGFVAVLASRFGEVHTETVNGPLGALVDAQWLLHGDTAYIECAQACGLHQLGGRPSPRTAVAADTYGVGQLIGAAVDAGAAKVVVGLGGSGSTDGGKGLVDALGGLDSAARLLQGVELVAASDVENPLLGLEGAAAVFGPQKGADPDTVAALEQRMSTWAALLGEFAGRDISPLAGAGAAGGLGAVLLALGGTRISGATVIADATGQADLIAGVDLVITGEGKCDEQTLKGKVVAALTSAARAHQTPTIVFAGQLALTPAQIAEAGIARAHAIVEVAGSVQRAMDDAQNQLTELTRQVAGTW